MKSCLQGLHAIFVAGECSEGRRWNRGNSRRVKRAHLANQRVAVFVRHGNVGEQHVDMFGLQLRDVCESAVNGSGVEGYATTA